MSAVIRQVTKNVGTTALKIAEANVARKVLMITNLDPVKTARVKFGAAIEAEVVEVQKLTFSNVPTFGVFKLKWNGNTTSGTVSYSGNAANVQTALRTLAGLASVTVAGDFTLGFTVTMTAAEYVDEDMPAISIEESTLEIAAVTEVQNIAFSATPDGGAIKFKYGTVASTSIAFGADATAVQTALRTIAGLELVTVTGTFAASFDVTFAGVLGDVALLTEFQNTLLDTATPVTTTITQGTQGVLEAETVEAVVEITKGNFLDGLFVAALGKIELAGDLCPIDAIWAVASALNTRLEIGEG